MINLLQLNTGWWTYRDQRFPSSDECCLWERCQNIKTRGPDAAFRRVGHILTCTEVNSHPIVKPFEMGVYWSVIKRSIFCLTIGCLKVEILGNFQKSLAKNWLLRSQNESKKFSKKSKKWWKIFSLLLFLCSIECIVFLRLDTMTIKPILHPLYSQKIRQITFWKWCQNL